MKEYKFEFGNTADFIIGNGRMTIIFSADIPDEIIERMFDANDLVLGEPGDPEENQGWVFLRSNPWMENANAPFGKYVIEHVSPRAVPDPLNPWHVIAVHEL